MMPEVVLDSLVLISLKLGKYKMSAIEPLMGRCKENAVFVTRQRLNYIQRLASFDYDENSLFIVELTCAPNKT